MHPNKSRYPFAMFMRHLAKWKHASTLTDVGPKRERKKALIHIGDDRSDEAMVDRILHMISEDGLVGKTRDFQAKRFHMAMRYLACHGERFRREFVMITDGTVTDMPSEVFAAVHEAFLDDPIPGLASVDPRRIVARAKEMQRTGIYLA